MAQPSSKEYRLAANLALRVRPKDTFRTVWLSLIPCILTVGQEALAQTPDAGAQQHELQHQIDQSRSEPKLPVIPPKASTPRLPAVGEETIQVEGFKVTGNTLILDADIQSALRPFVHRALSFNQIKDAAAAISALYAPIGRTAQALIPEQDVVDGIVLIRILEGHVGQIQIEQDETHPSRLDADVVKEFISKNNLPGELIDIFGLNRSIWLLNELPGNRVSAELGPGTENETTDIRLKAQDLGWADGHIDLSNYGSASTGEAQLTGSVNLNNPLGIGDAGSLDLIGAQGSFYGQGRFGVPVGADGFRVSLGFSALDYQTLSSFSTTISSGKAQTYGMYGDYALERSSNTSQNITLALEKKNYDNYTSGVQVSQYQIGRLSAGFNGVTQFDDNYLNWEVTVSGGELSMYNASEISTDQTGANSQGRFYKLNFNSVLSMPLTFVDNQTKIQLSINGQLANKNLNSAEQIYMGGAYGVKAYPTNQGGGTQGAITSLEVSHRFLSSLQLGVFFDAGLIQQYKTTFPNWQGLTNADNIYSLYATGINGLWTIEGASIQAAVAYRVGDNPLYNSSGIQLNSDNTYRRYQAWLKLSYPF